MTGRRRQQGTPDAVGDTAGRLRSEKSAGGIRFRYGGRLLAAVAVVGLLSGGVLTAAGGAEGRHGGPSRRATPVTFNLTSSNTSTLGSELCLDPSVSTANCLRASALGSVVLDGDLSASGVGTTEGMTAEGLRRTLGLTRVTVTDSPCGAGTITLETSTLLRLATPPALPEAVSTSWSLIPEQGMGSLAGVEAQGTFTATTVRPGGVFVSALEGKMRCA